MHKDDKLWRETETVIQNQNQWSANELWNVEHVTNSNRKSEMESEPYELGKMTKTESIRSVNMIAIEKWSWITLLKL